MAGVSPIPVVIAGVAVYGLKDKLQLLKDSYFGVLEIHEQVSLLALLFAAMVVVVSIAQWIAPLSADVTSNKSRGFTPSVDTHKDDDDDDHAPPPERRYPLTEMAKAGDDDKARFRCLFPMVKEELLAHMRDKNEMTPEAIEWCRAMMDYNVPGGKLNRGLTVVAVHRTLTQATWGRDLTPVEEARASVLGWAIEFLQAFFLVADDVMDESPTRRGQPCWYKLPKVKVIAINDSFLLESYVFAMLRLHFGHEAYYGHLVELFLDVISKTEYGQLLDLTTQSQETSKIDLTKFTLERYRLIVKYKTAFYSFYLPVAIGMITSGVTSLEAFRLARNICCIMGEYFQVQDDYLDCFGSPEVIGKVGTDIQDSKCSWLVVQALDRCSPQQRQVIVDNYGQWDDAKVAKIKALYRELDLPQVFATYEEDSYQRLQRELDQVTLMPRDVFELLLRKIYKRSK